MKTIPFKTNMSALALAASLFFIGACKKDEHKPPSMELKTGGSYISSNATVGKNETLTVGVKVEKTEDELKTYNISYAYDGATTTKTYENFQLSKAEYKGFDKDVTITTRSVAGEEKWIFTVTDRDGNIAKKEIVLTVQ
jgi:hypothetical protein